MKRFVRGSHQYRSDFSKWALPDAEYETAIQEISQLSSAELLKRLKKHWFMFGHNDTSPREDEIAELLEQEILKRMK